MALYLCLQCNALCHNGERCFMDANNRPDCTTCVKCGLNTYSAVSSPNSDALVCTACAVNNEALEIGSNACSPCPVNSESVPFGPCVCLGASDMVYMNDEHVCVSDEDSCLVSQYRDTFTRECSARVGTIANCLYLKGYVKTPSTTVSKGECGFPCPVFDTQYRARKEVYDDQLNLIDERLCLPLSECLFNEYRFVDGRWKDGMYVSNHVCRPITVCSVGEYQKSAATSYTATGGETPQYGVDAVCVAYTQCLQESGGSGIYLEFLQTHGTPTSDNVCQTISVCDIFTQFMSAYAVDAVSGGSSGMDATCQNRTICDTGYGVISLGDATHDNNCSLCPAGFVDNLGGVCIECLVGETFNPIAGQSNCTSCTTCPDATTATCTTVSDTTCATCPTTWKKNNISDTTIQMCAPCASGHLMTVGLTEVVHTVQNTVCMPCPAHTYCTGWGHIDLCPRMAAIFRDNIMHFIPSSPATSSRPSACTCHAVGGFEGHGGGMLGCTPCKSGYYAQPGMTTCSICPIGTYSKREQVADVLNCNAPQQAQWPSIGPVPSFTSNIPCKITVGATQCKICTSLMTRKMGATQFTDCSDCGAGQYKNEDSGNLCSNCITSCPMGTYLKGQSIKPTKPTPKTLSQLS
jgi:hypothetical protein